MSEPRDRPAGLARLAAFAATLSGLSGFWLVVLQNSSAAAAGKFWIIDHPWLNVVLYPALFGIAGALAGIGLELVRRLALRRVDPWAWSAAWASLGAYALRAAVTAAARVGDRVPGGAHAALAAQATLVLALVAVTVLLLSRQPPTGFRQALARGACIMIPTLAGIYLFHAVFLTDKHQVSQWGLLGLPVLALSTGIGIAGILLGVVQSRPIASGRTRWGRYATAGGLVALLALALGAQDRTRYHDASMPIPDGPNVLLVVLDTLRRDAVSAYRLVEGTTPRLDAFAREGVLWEDAIAPGSWTIPSHASLFTGALVSRHGAGIRRKKLRERPAGPRSPRLPTLAEIMRDRGWHTASFVNNGQINRAYAYDRGFLEYHEMWTGRTGVYDILGEAVVRYLNLASFDKGGAETNRALASWFAERAKADRPAFCFVNYVEPHAPYDSPTPWRDRFFEDDDEAESQRRAAWQRKNWRRAQADHKYGGVDDEKVDRYWRFYLGAVAYQDHVVGEMLDALEASGLTEDTVVIFTSDHGENFGWQGQLGHGWELNDDLIRIPLLARGPGIPAGVRDPTPATLIDILPTVLYLTGGDPTPDDPGRPGIVLPPIGPPGTVDHAGRLRVAERYSAYLADIVEFKAPGTVDRHWAFERAALLAGPWKATHVDADGSSRLTRLDDPFEPPSEDGRTAIDDPERLTSMLDQLAELRSSWIRAEDPSLDDLPNLDEEARRQLRALGYLD